MSDEKPNAADWLGRYHRALLDAGIEGDLLADIVRDAAGRLHGGELYLELATGEAVRNA